MIRPDTSAARWLRAVVAVASGRGFFIESCGLRLVVTACHCLPHPPPARFLASPAERLYPDLLALPGESPSVPAECLFADPVADLAVLGAPDPLHLADAFATYRAFANAAQELTIGAVQHSGAPPIAASLLSLDGRWIGCSVMRRERGLWFADAAEAIRGGSGGPIIFEDGTAVGVLCTASSEFGYTSGGPNPELIAHLPAWVWPGSVPPGCRHDRHNGYLR